MDKVVIEVRKEKIWYWYCPHCNYENTSYDYPAFAHFVGDTYKVDCEGCCCESEIETVVG